MSFPHRRKRSENDMSIKLVEVTRDDIETVWRMQIDAFSGLLEKYQDYDLSPGAEPVEKVVARFEQPWTKYYFITEEGERVGVIRIVDKKDGSRKRISPCHKSILLSLPLKARWI